MIAPPLSVASVTPSQVDIGAPDTPMVISGNGFVSSTVVEFDGVALPLQHQDWNRIEAVIPQALLTVASTGRLVIRSPAPGGGIESIEFIDVLRRSIIGENVPTVRMYRRMWTVFLTQQQ